MKSSRGVWDCLGSQNVRRIDPIWGPGEERLPYRTVQSLEGFHPLIACILIENPYKLNAV